MTRRITVMSLFLAAGLTACDSEPSVSGTAQVQGDAPNEPSPPPGPQFELHVEAPNQGYVGEPTSARVHVTPNPSWHVNDKAPAMLSIEPLAGVSMPYAKQERMDAERLDSDALVFFLPFTPKETGNKSVRGTVKFAMCGHDSCLPQTAPIAFDLRVDCSPQTKTC